ncbi:acetyltransferase [Rhizobium sp. Root274]|uniref:GNAT family N-acetyltransferase n=1 Tax=unclassified Rhizobium TaxID=2613769 RepID=UPI000715DEF6|nr:MULTISPECIES: GNAT family N-acetyltransferase [unclassified Rhizobium]KQW31966.1 acetyltransferase [Rhizobium sp. Root1240]KRD33505.1 acetyltransferase [Rhizobium sp. Root274]
MSERLTLRQGYFANPDAFQALADLLQDVFGIDITLQNRLGGPDPSSMPFGYFDETGRCIANFSAFAMPLVIEGRVVRAAGFQSGAVRPDYRGRGLYRDLMQRAFAWADAEGFEVGILLTDKPDLYRAFGFQVLPQFRFCGKVPPTTSTGIHSRDLDLANSDDVALVSHILANRQPVSAVFSVQRQSEMFLLNSFFDPEIRLSYLHTFDAVIAWKLEGESLHMLDIAAPRIPLMADICSALGVVVDRVEVCFPTDRLGWVGEARPYAGSCALMIRGLEPSAIKVPLMLSPLADF